MRHPRTFAVLLVAVFSLSACADQTVVGPQMAVDAAPSFSLGGAGLGAELPARHLVVFKGTTPANFDAAVAAEGGTVVHVSQRIGYAVVEGLDDAGAASLGTLNGVSLIESDAVIPMPQAVTMSAPEAVGFSTAPASAEEPAGAYFFPRQWHMRAIQADVAWAAGRLGSSDVTVAILDTGIGYTHGDLVGLVDLDRSISFVPIDDIYVNAYFPGAHPIADIGYHGTHVAATVSSNASGSAGVTSRTTLMGVKVCSVATGGCPGSAIFAGIEHAVENGADVINMSLGGAFLKSRNPGYISILNGLFNYAKQNNVTMVLSAGNEQVDLDRNLWPIYDEDTGDLLRVAHYPSLFKTYCNASHVICVSATGPEASAGTNGPWSDVDAPAYYTNYGRSSIDVAAPGGNSGGSVWAACSPFSLVVPVCQAGGYAVGIRGTSMAAPHVSGLAALAVEDVGKDVAKVRAYIRNSADAIGGGNTPFYGKGRINVANAVGAN